MLPYEPEPERKVSLSTTVGIAILVAMAFFVLGNRWNLLADSFLRQDTSTNSQLPADLNYSEVEQVYDLLRANYDGKLSVDQLMNGLKSGLAKATGDPYTVYLNEKESEQFLDDLNGSFTGIGAELGMEDGQLIIVAPLDGFPAQKAGLRAKDKIVSINGEDTAGITIEEAVAKIRGPKGTDVSLGIFRDNKLLEVTITRDKITVPSVTSRIEDGIGYLRISRFAEDTVGLATKAAKDFQQAKVKGVILDLRNNGGGFLSGAVNVAGLWLDGDVVVQERRGDTVTDTLSAPRGAILRGVKTVVLINEGSASASEIVAGALKDHGVATLVGETSFGKGSVQELKQVSSGGVLKVTIARWYTPNGSNIDKSGIAPDVEVKLSDADLNNNNDRQLKRAKTIINEQ